MLKRKSCASCGASIVWMKTSAGRAMPVDSASVAPSDDTSTLFDPGRHTSHFATCPNADSHRRR